MMLIAGAVVILVALAGLIVGLRGRRVDDHPRCRACGFDVVGLYPAAAACPECGRSLRDGAGGKPGVRIGNRRRRRRLIAVSSVLLVVSLVVTGLLAWDAASAGGWTARKPTWWLLLDTKSADPAAVDRALKELSKRWDEKRLTEKQFLILVGQGLAAQADEKRPWNIAWGTFIETAWRGGQLTTDQRKAYASNSVALRVVAREVIRQGDRVPAMVEVSTRMGSSPPLAVELSTSEMSIGGQQLLARPFQAGGSLTSGVISGSMEMRFAPMWQPWDSYGFRGLENDDDAVVAVEPGLHQLKTVWRLEVGPASAGRGFGGFGYGRGLPMRAAVEDVVAQRELEIVTPVRVVAASTETVELVKDERMAEAVRSAITVTIDDNGGGVLFSHEGRVAVLNVMNPPIDMAFDVTVHGPSREDRGRLLAGTSPQSGIDRGGASILLSGGEEDGTYDITLTPSAELARATTGVKRIWGEPITIKGVAPAEKRASPSGFHIAATLKQPPELFNNSFRSAGLRMPYVYVGDRMGDLYIFEVGEKDRAAHKDPVKIIQGVGDGNDLKVVGDVLLCTKLGSLIAYSLKDPLNPERIHSAGPAEPRHAESIVLDPAPGGLRAFLLGQGAIMSFDLAQPGHPTFTGVTTITQWPWAGCASGGYLYAAELSSDRRVTPSASACTTSRMPVRSGAWDLSVCPIPRTRFIRCPGIW